MHGEARRRRVSDNAPPFSSLTEPALTGDGEVLSVEGHCDHAHRGRHGQ
jgi:hypothetical protein